jgi:assimilatory nitrate reductase catalytic subunit
MNEIKSTCPYCGVGCGVVIETDNGKITGVRGDENHPANFGKLCSKGSTLHLTLSPSARATFPSIRMEKNIARERVSWDAALNHAATKFADTIAKHGPDSVAFYISGQLLTEDYYVFNKLAKGLIGTNNVDTNSRLCMSSAVAGYKATLGADAPPCAYEDIDHAECIFIVGSNTAYAHPILFRRIEAARAKNPNLKLIVADPRRTETASEADLFLQIKPGSDVALFNAMLRVMLDEDLINQNYIEAHTQGFAELKETLADYAPATVAELIGVAIEDIVQAARWFATSSATLSLYCQGLNQSARGTDKNAALINLHLATQQIGKPGAGPFSLTGQPNAMGGREVGGMANLLSAHRDLANAEHRVEVAKLWGVESVPATPGKTAVELFEALHQGKIKCVWIACTNPAQSMPDQTLIREALQRADFVVLQECYTDTETAQYADLLLPASTWGEKEGTVTNSERRISRLRAAIPPPGEARHDWQIAVDFALLLATKLQRTNAEKLFPYTCAEEIFNEHRETTRGRDLDITGLSYDILESRGPQQWPFVEHAQTGKIRLYQDGIFPTENGRAKFANTKFVPVAEATTAKFPLSLNTGRLRDQWHGMSRTGRAAQLFAHVPEPTLTMNPQTLAELGVGHHDFVTITSVRGTLTIPVEASADIAINEAFLPMHWGSRFVKGNGINALTVSAFDPVSRQPELKHAAVSVERVNLPWRLVAMAETTDANMLLTKLALHFDDFEYATCGLSGREHDVVVLRAAATKAVSQNVIDKLDALFGIDVTALELVDTSTGVARAMKVEAGKLVAMRLAGDISGHQWLGEWLESRVDIGALGYRALAGGNSPPQGAATRGRIVCACHNVANNEIVACFTAGGSMADAQKKLKCGTGCGSCLPELRRIELKIRMQATDENPALEELAA